MMRRNTLFAAGLVLALGLSSCADDGGSESDESQATGLGPMVNLATQQQPPTMDPLTTTDAAARNFGQLMYEPILVFDGDLEVQPMVVEDYEMNEDNTVMTLTMREGVVFHNGDEVTEDDILATLERWTALTNIGQSYFSDAEFESPEDGIVTITLPEPMALAPMILAEPSQPALVMPAEIHESAGSEGVEEHIGTGPYQWGDWQTDQYMYFTAFEDYVSRDEEPNGLAGAKQAYVEEIRLNFVDDASTRVNGVQTGEYDWANLIPWDNVEQLENDESVEVYMAIDGLVAAVPNKAEGIMADVNMRQAVVAATDTEQALLAAYGDEEFFVNNSALVEEGSPWYVEPDAAYEDFHQNADVDQAQEHLDAAGYDGEEIRLLASPDQDDQYNVAVMFQEQMTAAGMNVDLITSDWATLQGTREDPGAYDIYMSAWANHPVVPGGWGPFTPSFAGWTDDPELLDAAERQLYAPDDEAAVEAMEDLQQAMIDYVPIVKFGDRTTVYTHSPELEGFEQVPGVATVYHHLRWADQN